MTETDPASSAGGPTAGTAPAAPAAPATGRPASDGAGVVVCIPTFNEIENLPGLVTRVQAVLPAARVLVVDDDSPDGTGALADSLAAADPRVAVLHHNPRAGLGAAYVAPFTQLVGGRPAGEVAWVVQMDADGSHAPEDLPAMFAAADDADLVLGSRYVPGGRVVDWSRHRLELSRAGNAYSRWALRLPVRDVTGGFRLFRRGALADIPVASVASQGYCFQIDMVLRARRAGLRIREVPISFVERAHGESKMTGAVVREALWRVTAWAVRERRTAPSPPG